MSTGNLKDTIDQMTQDMKLNLNGIEKRRILITYQESSTNRAVDNVEKMSIRTDPAAGAGAGRETEKSC